VSSSSRPARGRRRCCARPATSFRCASRPRRSAASGCRPRSALLRPRSPTSPRLSCTSSRATAASSRSAASTPSKPSIRSTPTSAEGASSETLAEYRRGLVARLPGSAEGHWRGSWSAVYDVTPDWHPAIGYVAENVIVAAGFSGHGFKLAPAVGVTVAELVRDGHASSYDVGLLDPARFARDELVTTTYGYSVLG